MALQGTFIADFSSFQQECAKSEQALKGFEDQASKTSTAVDTISTASKTHSSVVQDLLANYQGVGVALKQHADDWDTVRISEVEADRVLSDLHTQLQAMPSTFGQVRGGLNQVAEGLGLTVDGIGLLESGLLAVGVAYEAWKVGRWIADLTGADAAIAEVTASTLGWGDVSKETAGAVGDVLANASAIAGRNIKDLSEAIVIVNRDYKEWSDNLARTEAPKRSAEQIALWRLEIFKIRESGVLPQLTTDLESNNFTVKNLADTYRISEGALQFYKRGLQEAAVAQRDLDAAERDFIATSDKWAKIAIDTANRVADAEAKAAQDNINVLHDLWNERVAQEKYVTQAITKETNERIITQFKESQAYQKMLDEFNKSLEIIPEVGKTVDDLTGSVDKGTAAVYGLGAAANATNDQLAEFWKNFYANFGNNPIGTPHPGPTMPGAGMQTRASGGPVSAGQSYLVGERGPELFTAGASGFITPRGGGGGVTVNNYINIVDTQANIARQVSKEIIRSVMSVSKLGAN